MNYGSFARICFMEKRLKIGLIFMLAAVVMMPVAFLFRNDNPSLTLAVIILTMLLELVGLIFVISNILKSKKN